MRVLLSRALLCLLLVAATLAACKGKPSERPEVHRARGEQYLKEGKLAEAALELQSAIAGDPRDAAAHKALAQVYARQGNVPGAFKQHLNVVSLDASDADSQIQVATGYLLARRFQNAAIHAAKAVEAAPARVEGHVALAQANAGLKKYKEAGAAVAKAIELAPRDDGIRLQQAKIELARREPKRAEEALRDGIRAIPASKGLIAALANLLASQKRTPEADALMRQLLESDAKNPLVYGYVARYRLRRGDPAGAESLLKKGLELAGEGEGKKDALSDLANFYLGTGDLPKGRGVLETLLTLAPDDPAILARLPSFGEGPGGAGFGRAGTEDPAEPRGCPARAGRRAASGRRGKAGGGRAPGPPPGEARGPFLGTTAG